MKRRTLVAAGLILPAVRPAMAQDVYPSRSMQIFVPFPPGGVADITTRPLAHVMGRLVPAPAARLALRKPRVPRPTCMARCMWTSSPRPRA
ncbi:MAG: hypothetical protein GEV13_22435 [Rhodospirillales bacterium]|nr:hypothetical protein [Rhodospirillales bacterium]